MSVGTVALIVALVLALVVQFKAQGRDLLAWAVVAICVGGLWGAL